MHTHTTNLPTYCLITPSNKNLTYLTALISAYKNLIIQYRDPEINLKSYINNAKKLITVAHQNHHQILLNSDPDLAHQLHADGVHLNSDRLIKQTNKPDALITSASCHNILEIEKANQLALDFVMLSPIKYTDSHPKLTQFLDWDGFEELTNCCTMPTYALGGVSLSEITLAKKFGGWGIAAIGAFSIKNNKIT